MRTRRMIAVLCFLAGAAVPATVTGCRPSSPAKTQALVVGTIHQRHARNENYTYEDVVRILETFDPDLVCVEIRPQDFRKTAYLKEMMLATIWGLARGKAVAPIDWWDDREDTREVRDKLAKEPEYVAKEKRYDELCRGSEIVKRYEQRYGPADQENKWSAHLGYAFWNGADYNAFYAEIYRISMEVYGDSPFNLYYQTRNGRMMELIREAVRRTGSRRAIVLTGAEHKHFFDRAFGKDPAVETVDFASLLPLKTSPAPVAAVTAFLEDDDDAPYYEKGYPADLAGAFRDKLVPLVHGPDMDVFPEKVPSVNIGKAQKVLGRWKAALPESERLAYEKAWLDFLVEDYAGAIATYRRLAAGIDDGSVKDPYIRFSAYLNLGRCLDLTGNRAEALKCYARSEELIAGTRWERAKAYIFQDYRKVPYRRPKPMSRRSLEATFFAAN